MTNQNLHLLRLPLTEITIILINHQSQINTVLFLINTTQAVNSENYQEDYFNDKKFPFGTKTKQLVQGNSKDLSNTSKKLPLRGDIWINTQRCQ